MFINVVKKVLLIATCGVIIPGNCFGDGSVKISVTKKGKTETSEYTCLKSVDDARNFAIALENANEDQIILDSSGSERKISDAVKLVLSNTVKFFDPNFSGSLDSFAGEPLDKYKKALLVAVLFELRVGLSTCGINASIYCSNLLHKIAEDPFDKAKMLLLSQCNPNDDSFIPIENADWRVIGRAIGMLQHEKDGSSKIRDEFLVWLKNMNNKPYKALLGDGTNPYARFMK